MIVFYFGIGIIVFISITIFSSIIVNAHVININSLEELKNIYHAYTEKNYNKIFKFIDLKVDITIKALGILPIKIIKLDSLKIRNIIVKIKTKEDKQKQKDIVKYEKMKLKQKELANKMILVLIDSMNIDEAELKAGISLSNMGVTALISSILNIVISIIITFLEETINLQYTSKNKPQKSNKILQNIYYKITPIYNTKFYFQLHSKLKLKIPIYKLLYNYTTNFKE